MRNIHRCRHCESRESEDLRISLDLDPDEAEFCAVFRCVTAKTCLVCPYYLPDYTDEEYRERYTQEGLDSLLWPRDEEGEVTQEAFDWMERWRKDNDKR